jgi:hypothetical protein
MYNVGLSSQVSILMERTSQRKEKEINEFLDIL